MPVSRLFFTSSGKQKLEQQKIQIKQHLNELSGALADSYAKGNKDTAAMILADKLYYEQRLLDVDTALARTKVMHRHTTRRIGLGSKVLLMTESGTRSFTLVDTLEADPASNSVSPDSPLGRALMGHRVNETVTIDLPGKKFDLTIARIE